MEGPAKKRFRSGSDGDLVEHRDINDLPVEVLIKIFKYCVESNSASSLLSSFYYVCSRWRNIVETSTLWNEIPRDENMTINMFWFLSKKGLLLNTTSLSLYIVCVPADPFKLVRVFQNCPCLKSLWIEGGLIYGSVVSDVFNACRKLESVTFTQMPDYSYEVCSDYFLKIGWRLRCINLHGVYIDWGALFFDAIADYCPNLEEMRVAKLEGNIRILPLEKFQTKCSKLSIMVLHDVHIHINERHKNQHKETNRNHGFTNLISFSYNREIQSWELLQLFRGARRLKFLNIGYSPDEELQSICELPIIDLRVFCVAFSTPSFALRTIMKAKWPNLEFPSIANKATELPSHILKNLHPDWINYV